MISDNNKIKVGLVSLGCDKNRVDSEKLLAEISKQYDVTSSADAADVLVINTCAFLAASRKEAVESVIDYSALKKTGKLKKIIVTGCLPQKFVGEMFDEFTEADGFLGTFDGSLINSVILRTLRGERVNAVGLGEPLGRNRILTTPQHYAYLKIADGCDNRCTYCLIPKIRGKFVSEPIENVIEEARSLCDTEEIVLVAQDVTRYGEDLYGKPSLTRLLRELSALENVKKIRLLYCYPELISDELIDEIASNDKIVKYLDVPFQHASDRILKLMNRRGTNADYLSLVKKLKERIKGVAIRSTFIAGFPTETEEDFEILKDFILKAELFNAGFFAYSKESDTPAFKLKGHLPQRIKRQRVKELYALQKTVVEKNMSAFVGKTIEVVCDGVDYNKQKFFGRAYFNAPDIDGLVYLSGEGVIEQGKRYAVRIEKYLGYDLYGVIENELT